MPLIIRRKLSTAKWAVQAAYAGALQDIGKSPDQIAKQMQYGVAYVAQLLDLWEGYNQFPSLLYEVSIENAQRKLKQLRYDDLIRRIAPDA